MRSDPLTAPGAAALVLDRDADGAQRAKPRGCKARPVKAVGPRPGSADLKREVCVSFRCSALGRQCAAQRGGVESLDIEQLVACRGSAGHADAAGRDAEARRDEPADRVVRAAVNGRGRHSDQDRARALAADLVATRARLDAYCDPSHTRSLGAGSRRRVRARPQTPEIGDAPRGAAHTYANHREALARALIVCTPAGCGRPPHDWRVRDRTQAPSLRGQTRIPLDPARRWTCRTVV
jgi:hypothetical protein